MESKVFIDIDHDGSPQIRIEYNHVSNGDVRDKLIGRFLTDLLYASPQLEKIDVSLICGHRSESGGVAFIALKPKASAEETEADNPVSLKAADDWAVLNLSPDLYRQWKKEVFGQEHVSRLK